MIANIETIIKRLRGFDTETYLFAPGIMAPKIVCGSASWVDDEGKLQGALLENQQQVIDTAEAFMKNELILVGAHNAFDNACLAEAKPEIRNLIFEAYRKGLIFDVLIAESLNAIFYGHLGLDPKTGDQIRSPSTFKPSKRYSLEIVLYLVTGKVDAKQNDIWRRSYALLEGLPAKRWPPEAVQYPIDDVINPLHIAIEQLKNYENLSNMRAQAEAAFALNLGAIHGFRTSAERIEKLSAKVDKLHADAVARFTSKGWIRPYVDPETGKPNPKGGTEDEIAIKKAVAAAYGAQGPCKVCQGKGEIPKFKQVDCRGEKIKGRYQGCQGESCETCQGKRAIMKDDGTSTCKGSDGGCDGTGLDITQATFLPRSDKGGIKKDRDTLMETIDEDLSDFGQGEFEKLRTTYIPYLKKGIHAPLTLQPNILLYTGRISYSDPIQQFPRKGGARECICARPGCVLCSVDYASGELCTLSFITKIIVGYSKMMDAINESGDPGSLHTLLAAQMMGISFEEAKERVKAGDKRAKDFRQAAKCFHPDTEILTRHRGWVRIANLTMDDEVASVVPRDSRPAPVPRVRDSMGRMVPAQDGHTREWHKKNTNSIPKPTMEIVWTKPTRLTTRKATEGLLHLKNESIDLRVTPDHRMLAYGSTKLLKTVEAKEFGKQRGWFNAGMWNGGEYEVDERILRLAVATQADGSYLKDGKPQSRIVLNFSKKRKIDRLASMLRQDEYVRATHKNGKYVDSTRFTLTEDLSTKIKELLDPDKTIPWAWLELTPKLRAAVLDEVAFWDAHIVAKCYHFSTTIKKNSEVLQAMAVITNRKATYIKPTLRTDDNHETCHVLSVKTKYDTRGENVSVTKLDYYGDVYCLSVPSEHILVRDGGISAITLNCGNFGLPGGMGSATFVLTKRKKNEGTTVAPDGTKLSGIRFCVLLGGAERCGEEKITKWKGRDCAPICRMCTEIVESQLKPAFFTSFPEVKEYLKWVTKQVNDNGRVPCYGWNHERGEKEILRWRGGCTFTSGANTGFQALLSDISKLAYVNVTRESYLGVKPDGSPSPLAGSRHPLLAHDEILSELFLETAHPAAYRVSELMIDAGNMLAPGVCWRADPSLMLYWDKDAATVFEEINGKKTLVPWVPKEEH